MKFDYNEYFKILFIASLFIVLFFVFILVINSIRFFKNNMPIKFDKHLGAYLSSVIVCLFFFSIAFFPMQHGIYLVKEKETDKIECTGVITDFKKTYGNNKYIYEGHTTFASYVFIDDEKYYIMYTGDLEVGDEVVFEYLPKSRIILSIDEK